jgi:hypothetical protein
MAKKKRKSRYFAISGLQSGKVVKSLPTTSMGTAVGTSLGKSSEGHLAITYEKALCSCAGENENCFRCDGTGFYTKQIVQDISKLPPALPNSGLRTKNQTPAESTFSNDSRGGDYGIRERGRFGSGPLHDDHE